MIDKFDLLLMSQGSPMWPDMSITSYRMQLETPNLHQVCMIDFTYGTFEATEAKNMVL